MYSADYINEAKYILGKADEAFRNDDSNTEVYYIEKAMIQLTEALRIAKLEY